MKVINVLAQRVVRVALIASMVLGGFPAMHAQQKVAATDATAAREKPTSGRIEGIKVHGHWTITVRNADGSVASRNEFENSLNPSTGSAALSQMLGRTATPGLWSIDVVAVDSAGSQLTIFLFEAASTVPAGFSSFKGLLVSADAAGLHLSGTAKAVIAQPTGTIAAVNTQLYTCPATAAPAAPCSDANLNYKQITSRTLSPQIPIQQNQSIDVTVTITFS
jgi:hypothetical protein